MAALRPLQHFAPINSYKASTNLDHIDSAPPSVNKPILSTSSSLMIPSATPKRQALASADNSSTPRARQPTNGSGGGSARTPITVKRVLSSSVSRRGKEDDRAMLGRSGGNRPRLGEDRTIVRQARTLSNSSISSDKAASSLPRSGSTTHASLPRPTRTTPATIRRLPSVSEFGTVKRVPSTLSRSDTLTTARVPPSTLVRQNSTLGAGSAIPIRAKKGSDMSIASVSTASSNDNEVADDEQTPAPRRTLAPTTGATVGRRVVSSGSGPPVTASKVTGTLRAPRKLTAAPSQDAKQEPGTLKPVRKLSSTTSAKPVAAINKPSTTGTETALPRQRTISRLAPPATTGRSLAPPASRPQRLSDAAKSPLRNSTIVRPTSLASSGSSLSLSHSSASSSASTPCPDDEGNPEADKSWETVSTRRTSVVSSIQAIPFPSSEIDCAPPSKRPRTPRTSLLPPRSALSYTSPPFSSASPAPAEGGTATKSKRVLRVISETKRRGRDSYTLEEVLAHAGQGFLADEDLLASDVPTIRQDTPERETKRLATVSPQETKSARKRKMAEIAHSHSQTSLLQAELEMGNAREEELMKEVASARNEVDRVKTEQELMHALAMDEREKEKEGREMDKRRWEEQRVAIRRELAIERWERVEDTAREERRRLEESLQVLKLLREWL